MDLDQIFPVWLHSFLFTERQREVGFRRDVEGLPCVRYDFVWQGAKVLSDNYLIRGRDSHAAVSLVQSSDPAPDHLLRVVEDQPGLRDAYEKIGYQVNFVETLMARPLTNLSIPDKRADVKWVRGHDRLDWVNHIEGQEDAAAMPADLDDPTFRFYVLRQDKRTLCRARSAHYSDTIAWGSHVFTDPAYRKQGLAQAVMKKLLWDDAAAGHTFNFLLSTQAGHSLYHHLGYQNIATVATFHPKNN